MSERAQRIGAQIDIFSTPQRGSSVVLTLPLPSHPSTSNPTRLDSTQSVPKTQPTAFGAAHDIT
jgi:two-component system nitrate/nitrite sensor histidine kinase NarX